MLRKTLTLTAALVAGVTLAAQAVKVDPKVTTYKKVAGISGNLNSIGSDRSLTRPPAPSSRRST